MTASSRPLLEARRLSKRFAGVTALHDVSLRLHPGEIVGLAGPNGCGKTTLLNILSGTLSPDAGQVLLDEKPVRAKGVASRARLGIVRVFQEPRIFRSLSVAESLRIPADESSRTSTASSRTEQLSLFNLARVADALTSTLSHGQRKLLGMAAAFMMRPRVLLLDEPTSGLASHLFSDLKQILAEVARSYQCAFLIVEHNLSFLRDNAARCLLMREGRLIHEGPSSQVLTASTIKDVYLQ